MKHTPESVREIARLLPDTPVFCRDHAKRVTDAATMLSDLLAENERMREALEQFTHCARYDATMEGPKLRGWDRSELDRSLTTARAALTPESKE